MLKSALSALDGFTRLSTRPFKSSVNELLTSSVDLMPISPVSLTDLPAATAFFNVVSLSTSVNVTCAGAEPSPSVEFSPTASSAQAAETSADVTSPDVTKTAPRGSAHTNTNVSKMGSSRFFIAVPPRFFLSPVFLSALPCPRRCFLPAKQTTGVEVFTTPYYQEMS